MTRLKKLALGGATAALIMTGAASQSFAVEPASFTNNLSGASMGLPLGAAPPPGLYSGFETLTGAGNSRNAGNQNFGPTGVGLDVTSGFVGVVPIVWSTGWHVFGGSVVLDVIQAFYDINVAGPGLIPVASGGLSPPFITSINFPTVANTTWGGSISWNLGQGWFAALGFAFEAPDGSRYKNSIGVGTLNPDYWSFEPTAAISYLANNWVLSANMAYFFNTASKGITGTLGSTPFAPAAVGWLNGEEFYLDLTALYKFGKWELGPVAALVAQTTSDQPGSGFTCASNFGGPQFQSICGKEFKVQAGGLIGYDFGPVDFQVWATDVFECRNTPACGLGVWSRLGFRIWGPEAPAAKPLVTKN